MPEAVFNTAVYFKNAYEDEWITDPIAREMILDIDKSTVLDSAIIDSPVMGKISPLALSGGAKWILKLTETDDLTVNLRHLMDFGEDTFAIRILNTNQIVHSMKELVPIAGLYV